MARARGPRRAPLDDVALERPLQHVPSALVDRGRGLPMIPRILVRSGHNPGRTVLKQIVPAQLVSAVLVTKREKNCKLTEAPWKAKKQGY